MKPCLRQTQMSALAFLHDHVRGLPPWFRPLTARQFEDIAEVMVQWKNACENYRILPMQEIEKREVLRAVLLCEGSILKAAKLLKLGKTTIYRKLTQWGYSVHGRTLTEQASDSSRRSKERTKESYKCG